MAKELKSALSNIKLADRGVYVQASTLGSLEALLEFLRTSKIPVSTETLDLLFLKMFYNLFTIWKFYIYSEYVISLYWTFFGLRI